MEKLNVLVDYHHQDLYQFLRLLIEKRFGWNLYRPIGPDWASNKIWLYSKDAAIITQYLQFPNPKKVVCQEGIYFTPEPRHAAVDKCITLDKFKEMRIDIIIGTVANHDASFSALAKSHWSKPKYIRLLGNINEVVDSNYSKNVISTVQPAPFSDDINTVFCHQEFDLKKFHYRPPVTRKSIKSFVNNLPLTVDYPLYNQYKALLPDYDWKMHGGLGEDGSIGNVMDMSFAISDSSFVWHVKRGGDGFGHSIHNSCACGRPLITKKSYYTNMLAEPLMVDGKTCIDLECHTVEENVRMIKDASYPDVHNRMCEDTYKRFCEVVNYDAEFIRLKEFFNNLR